MRLEQVLRPVKGVLDNVAHLGVDLNGRLFRVVFGLRNIPTQEYLLFFFPKGHGAEALAHTPLADHASSQVGRFFEIVSGTGRGVAKDQFFGYAATEHDGQAFQNIVLGKGVTVVNGQLLSHAQGHAARNNGHLMNRVRSRNQSGNQGVAGLVVGRIAALIKAENHAATLGAHEDFVLGQLEVVHFDFFFVFASRQKRGLVDQVFQVSPGKPRCTSGQLRDVNLVVQWHPARMHVEDFLSTANVRRGHNNPPVKPPRAQQGRIQDVRTVGRRNQNDTLVCFKAIHLHQELVEGLLTLVMPAAEAGTAMASNRINLINKNDARRLLFPLNKEVADARSPDPDKHLNKVGTADREERHPGFPGNRPGEQGFSGSGRPDQQDPFGDTPPQTGELFRVFEKGDDFFQLLFGLFHAGNVAERDTLLVFRQQFGPALAERHGLATTHLHLAHEEDPHADQEQHRKPLNQDGDIPGVALFRPRGHPYPPVAQGPHEVGVVGGSVGLEAVVIAKFSTNDLPLNNDLGDLTFFYSREEITKDNFRFSRLLTIEQVEHEQEDHPENQPQCEIRRNLIHSVTFRMCAPSLP